MALQNYHSVLQTFPPGAVSEPTDESCPPEGRTNTDSFAPWTVQLLPYLELASRYQSFDFARPFFGLRHPLAQTPNEKAQLLRCEAFECPSDPNSSALHANCNYFGVQGGGEAPQCRGAAQYRGRAFFENGVLFNNSRVRLGDITDGATQTAVCGETRYMQLAGPNPDFYGTWASSVWLAGSDGPSSVYVTLAGTMEPINSYVADPVIDWTLEHQSRVFGSRHPGGCHFLLGDGGVRFISQLVDVEVYRSLGTRDDEAPVGNEF